MGKYVEKTSHGRMGASYIDKVKALSEDGATVVPKNELEFTENLICVVNNGSCAAAAYAYDEKEMLRFIRSFNNGDRRPHTWMIYEKVNEML